MLRRFTGLFIGAALLLASGCKIFKPCDCPKFGKSSRQPVQVDYQRASASVSNPSF